MFGVIEPVRPEVAAAIRSLIVERIGEAAIDKLLITSDDDHDGDPFLRVWVELRSDLDQPSAVDRLDLLWAMRGRLEALREHRFPHYRFLTPSDLADMYQASPNG